MNESLRIKDTKEFEYIINIGKKKVNSYYIIYYTEKKFDNSRFGITFSKKFGNAVKRNKFKRRLREIIRINLKLFKNKYDYIIIIRKSCDTLNYKEMQSEFIKLI